MDQTADVQSGENQEATPNGGFQEGSTNQEAVSVEEITAVAKSLKKRTTKDNSGGVDWVEPKKFYEEVLLNPELQLEIQRKLLNKRYKHKPFRITEIPKSSGGTRKVSIPTAVDRICQRITCGKLGELVEGGKLFHENSMAYRRGKSTMKAAWTAARLNSTYSYVARLDLESFYDSINRERLLHMVSKIGLDDIHLHVVSETIYASRKENGQLSRREVGIAQGGPLCPLLANIYLNRLDWQLEAHYVSFIRFADDILLFAQTEEEAKVFVNLVGRYCVKYLGLHLNREKTRIYKSEAVPFLGYIIRPSGVDVDLHDLSERLQVLWNNMIERPHQFYSLEGLARGALRQRILGLLAYYRCTTNFADAKSLCDLFISKVETHFSSLRTETFASYASCYLVWEFCMKETFSELRKSINNIQPSGI